MMERDLSHIRITEYPIEPLLRNRWSPRAMSGQPIDTQKLMSLFEAAKWAPSSYNAQPWRFLYATRDGEHWQTFFDLLAKGNQTWAANTAALIVVISKKTMDNGAPSITYCFDAGAAWQNLALQAYLDGLVVHGMQGFDYAKAREALHIPDEFAVMAMLAVGLPGDPQDLPEQVRRRESPSLRKGLGEIVFEGPFDGG
jgi:nitroreductase